MSDLVERPWRCDVTKNPVGTDTIRIGSPPCDCQGCRAASELTRLRAEVEALKGAADENVPTERLEVIFGKCAATPSEIHDMAVELILRRRVLATLAQETPDERK